MQADPYAPPQSSLGAPTPAELTSIKNGELVYSTFWQRVGAYLIDFIILSPLIAVDYLLGSSTRYFQLLMFIPGQLLAAYFYIYLVRTYGGTPGKLLVGLRIAMTDGSPVTYRAAFLRYAVLWVITILMTSSLILAALGMSDEAFVSLGYMERGAALSANGAAWMGVVTVLMQVWFVASLVTILANKRRRALHDYIAGTAVVRKSPVS